jgi:hypothetical protein
MFARRGRKPPRLIRSRSPADVARAVVKAIERNEAEVEVASLGLRVVSRLSGLAPAFVAKRS